MAVSPSAIQIINNSKNISDECFRQGYSKEQYRTELTAGREESKQLLYSQWKLYLLTFVICGHLCCPQNKQPKEGENIFFSYC